jgi:hypothetical protein
MRAPTRGLAKALRHVLGWWGGAVPPPSAERPPSQRTRNSRRIISQELLARKWRMFRTGSSVLRIAQRVTTINARSLNYGSVAFRSHDRGTLRRCMHTAFRSTARGTVVARNASTTSAPKSWLPRMLWRMVWIPYATLTLIPLTTGLLSMYHYSGTRHLCAKLPSRVK